MKLPKWIKEENWRPVTLPLAIARRRRRRRRQRWEGKLRKSFKKALACKSWIDLVIRPFHSFLLLKRLQRKILNSKLFLFVFSRYANINQVGYAVGKLKCQWRSILLWATVSKWNGDFTHLFINILFRSFIHFWIFFLLLSFLFSWRPPKPPPPSPIKTTGWELRGLNCYKYFGIKHSWEKAAELCRR